MVTTSVILVVILATISFVILYTSNDAGKLLSSLTLSLSRLILAYLLSLVIATVVAVFVSNSKVGDFLIPVFDLMQNLPSFALIPIFVLWFGYSDWMIIIFAATSILWPILFYMMHALKTVRRDLEDAVKIFGAVGWKKIWFFSLPVAFPSAVTGSIVGFSIGWEAVIGIEIIGLSTGIGPFLNSNVAGNNNLLLGISALLVVVFLINRLIWMPLLRKSQLYVEQ
jgi:ABC-type nitrate/sulfonate/bicarbonate transport system permease component